MTRAGSKTCSGSTRLGRGLMAVALATMSLCWTPAQAGDAAPLRHAKLADLGREEASAEVRHIANWAVDSGDHGGLPFVVVDKVESRVFVFDAEGRLRGASAALVGAARGDNSVPGIGSRKISSILPQERTTPAGRYAARMGRGPNGEDILWVDYEGALALHRVVTNVPQERRLQRLASNVAQDRRITYGCINVPVKFYDAVVQPTFSERGGIVYILPESRRPQDLFGSYDVGSGGLVPASAVQ
ncbi:MAG: hypothetical protein JWP41_3486 [Ramlibacter sp.]|nr:hypothetical protein [Ramlibacter sp.]